MHRSENIRPQSSVTHTNGSAPFVSRSGEQTRPSKRKREFDSDEKNTERKEKKKKRQTAENSSNNDNIAGPELDREESRSGNLQTRDSEDSPSKPTSNEDTIATSTTPSAQSDLEEAPSTNSKLNRAGKSRKVRGARISEKNNLKVGFFVEAETQKLEQHKVEFCNRHGFTNHQIFDAMVQHSERDRESGEWPCPNNVCKKSEFWAEIYALLPDRDRRSLYRFMRRHFQDSTQKPHEWTAEQDDELIRLRAIHGPKYALIAKKLGRSDDDVTQRWKNRLEHRGTQKRGAWSVEEMQSLMGVIQDIWNVEHVVRPQLAGKDIYELDERAIVWGNVSRAMNHVRSRQQCADRWRKIRRHVETLRQTVDPEAVFDPVDAVKRNSGWRTFYASKDLSDERVVDDDDDDEDEMEDESTTHIPGPVKATEIGPTDKQEASLLDSASIREKSAAQPLSRTNAEPHVEQEPESVLEAVQNIRSTATDGLISSSVVSYSGRPDQQGSRSPGQSMAVKAEASKPTKKRKRSETGKAGDGPEDAVMPQASSLHSLDTEKLARKAAKKEKKRLKKERRMRQEREEQEEREEWERQEREERERQKQDERERQEAEEREHQKAEAAAAAAKQAKKAKKKAKRERLEKERLEKERIENQRLEKERLSEKKNVGKEERERERLKKEDIEKKERKERKKAKKEKKEKEKEKERSTNAVEINGVDAAAASTEASPPKKRKKHRKSISEPNGTLAERTGAIESKKREKSKKSKRATQE